MKLLKIHSMTDLITNSSTTIYTYSDNSIGALQRMIDEFFRVLGIDKKCADVFTVTLVLDANYRYIDELDEMDEEDVPSELRGNLSYNDREKLIKEYVERVVSGEMEKPEWMKKVESNENGDGLKPSNIISIVPKSPEYADLAKLIVSFLYSTQQESSYNG